MKIPTIVGICISISRENMLLSYGIQPAQVCLARKKEFAIVVIWDLLAKEISSSAKLSIIKSFITSEPDVVLFIHFGYGGTDKGIT